MILYKLWYDFVSYNILSYDIVSCNIIQCCIMWYNIMWYNINEENCIISYHMIQWYKIISYNRISYHIQNGLRCRSICGYKDPCQMIFTEDTESVIDQACKVHTTFCVISCYHLTWVHKHDKTTYWLCP